MGQRFGLADVNEMRTAHVARALIGRPAISGGRAYVKINAPILECDTKKLSDGIRIIAFLEGLSTEDEQIILALISDGQSMLLLLYLKRRFPERYRHILILCGNFHAFGHFMFGGQESYHDCFTGYFSAKLHKEKVPKLIPDFQNDSYMHTLAHFLELTIGSYSFMVQNVVEPSFDLFLSNPALYETSIENAGGLVMFKFLQNVGTPVLHWLLAGREANGQTCEDLHCLSFHQNRATTHKVNCVMISLLAILSTCATDPTAAAIAKDSCAFSATGKEGSLSFGDRYLEWLNLLQDQRDGKFAAFDKALHYTDHLEALMHVEQAWQTAKNGASPLHDPVRQSTLNAAEVVRKELLAKLGTDLTIPNTHNPFWYTGNPVNLAGGAAMRYRPWEYVQNVAAGLAAGKDRVSLEAWDAFLARMIAEQLFPY